MASPRTAWPESSEIVGEVHTVARTMTPESEHNRILTTPDEPAE